MPELVPPHVRYQKSFLEAAEEILRSTDDDHYAGLSVFPPVDGYPGEEYELEELRVDGRHSREFARRLRSTADDEFLVSRRDRAIDGPLVGRRRTPTSDGSRSGTG